MLGSRRAFAVAAPAQAETAATTVLPGANMEAVLKAAQIAKTEYLVGNEITAVDLALYPIYAGRKALLDNAVLKNLQAWGDRIGARPGVQKGMKLEI